MLFTINKPIFSSNSFKSAFQIASNGSPLLLYEDGVYNAIPGAESETMVKEALQTHPVFALDTDLKARGIKKVIEGIEVISYDGFVELVEEHNVAPWL